MSSEDEQVDDEEHEEVDDEEEHVREVQEQEREEGFGGDLDALQQLLKEKDGIIQSSTRLAKAQIDRLTEELHAERKYVLPLPFFLKKGVFQMETNSICLKDIVKYCKNWDPEMKHSKC
ncbi:MAG: hypothetical protein Q8P67_17820 [archaeon]|nr:hypothetical protein [archaeon]